MDIEARVREAATKYLFANGSPVRPAVVYVSEKPSILTGGSLKGFQLANGVTLVSIKIEDLFSEETLTEFA